MLGFTLSKLNLLIFVIALATIILFFSTGLYNVMVGQRAGQIAERLSYSASSLVASETTCDSIVLHLPKYINVFSGAEIESTTGTPYLLRITSIPRPGNEDINYLVFSVALKTNPDNPVAAVRLQTIASIRLFDLNVKTPSWQEQRELLLNPLGAESINVGPTEIQGSLLPDNRIVIIKESLVKPVIYIFPCTITSEISSCEIFGSGPSPTGTTDVRLHVPAIAKPDTKKFDCFPKEED